jgi:hypothetical protein
MYSLIVNSSVFLILHLSVGMTKFYHYSVLCVVLLCSVRIGYENSAIYVPCFPLEPRIPDKIIYVTTHNIDNFVDAITSEAYNGYRVNWKRNRRTSISTINNRSIENTTREQVLQQSTINDNGEIRYQTLYTTC